jgi:carboxymethylenebutenolidase
MFAAREPGLEALMKRWMAIVAACLLTAPLFAQQTGITVPWNDKIPPGTPEHAAKALADSPRHGEWVDISLPNALPLNAWVVYPERKDKSGVVLVIHDIGGMRDWPRALGDQLAENGFIAIVPDFLSGKGPNGGGSASLGTGVNTAIRALTPDEVNARLDAAMNYGKALPSSNGKTGVIGFCWGGNKSFGYAIHQPNLSAAVVYYGEFPGTSPGPPTDATDALAKGIRAPVIGFYGGNDSRINSTLEWTTATMKKYGKPYETHIFDGAGHGFLGQQAGQGGANLKASEQAWPLTTAFLTKHLK